MLSPNSEDFEAAFSGPAFWKNHIDEQRSASENWTPDLKGAEFYDVKFARYDFRGANLQEAIFEGAELEQSRFNRANLIRANFRNTDLQGVNFERADLREADFRGAVNYRGANFLKARMAGAKLPNNATSFDEPFDDANFEISDNASAEDPIFEHTSSTMSIGEPIVDQAEIERTHKKLSDLVGHAQGLKEGLQEVFDKANTNSHNLVGSMEGAKTQEITLTDKIIQAEDAHQKVATLVSELNMIKDSFGTFVETQRKETIDGIRATLKPELEAAKSEVRAAKVLEQVEEAWRLKYSSHYASFMGGAILFFVLICVFGILISQNFEAIKDTLVFFGTQKNYLGTFAIISAPLAAIAWILRLISRFTLQNLNLAHDAQQRKVTIDTYTKLVGTPNAIIEDTDRAIMLNSIFRPLPGNNQTDLAQPSLADFLGKKDVSTGTAK